MHGLVALDDRDRVIRPAILWNDGRTQKQVDYLNETVGRETLSACTGNIAFAGFTAPKLLWMRENEPENFARIEKILLPKDYVNYRLTGVFSAPTFRTPPACCCWTWRTSAGVPGCWSSAA
jgi:xylulokinase